MYVVPHKIEKWGNNQNCDKPLGRRKCKTLETSGNESLICIWWIVTWFILRLCPDSDSPESLGAVQWDHQHLY